jgi:GH24 family phage-related lysozyme (muramidase)
MTPILDVPPEVTALLMLREGWKTVSYEDTVNKLTAGMGHLLSASEMHRYPKGTPIPDAVLQGWKQQDSLNAYRTAVAWANTIGESNPILVNALASVCFQMGMAWPSIFKTTWKFLLAHDWNNAAMAAGESLWARQTPARVDDFKQALYALADAEKPA